MPRTKNALTILILLLVGLFLRVLNITKDISGDESWLIQISSFNLKQIFHTLIQTEVYPPFTYILMHYWLKVSDSIIWVKFYFILFSLGTCILVYLLAKEYFDIKIAKLALVLAIFSPLLIFMSQYVRSCADSSFWILASLFFLLKLIKDKNSALNWIGYIITTIISIYNFYFSFLLIFSQIFFITIFKWNNKKFLVRFFLALIVIGLVFLPWLTFAVKQFSNLSSIVYDWSGKGFNIGFLRLGLYTRNIFSLIGFDPNFMVLKGGINKQLGNTVLLTGVLLFFSLSVIFLLICFRFLRNTFRNNKAMAWFLHFFTFFPLVISWIYAMLLNTLPNARYLISLHAIFLILIAIFAHNLAIKRRPLGKLFIIFILLIYMIRIPYVISSNLDTQKGINFFKKISSIKDCVICTYSCPPDLVTQKIIIEERYIILNEKKSAYIPLPDEVKLSIEKKLKPFNNVWFYRLYNNRDEIFGLNNQIDLFLKSLNFQIKKKIQFRSVDFVQYEKNRI